MKSEGKKIYKPTWESLDSRPCPLWFTDAKFGIFIHWGLYSVPAWAPKGKYAEWYWYALNTDPQTRNFHNQTYGRKFKYQDFAGMFKTEMFEPDKWANLFTQSGAKYVVLTSKHHDGFCLWPSSESWNWNSVDIGPHRDLVGELTKAVRKKGLKMGLYYSLYEWFNPLYLTDVNRYVNEHMLPQLKDLVIKYQPSVIFADGEWEHPSEVWKSEEFLAWLYNESPNSEEVVVNDRWGKETRTTHGGYYTSEYGGFLGEGKEISIKDVWEESRGMGASFGYNRNEEISDYKTAKELIHLLIDIVSKGGNLLLDIGPTADGRIPVIMQERLLEIGEWLKINGEAIYGTRPWSKISDGKFVRYTSKYNIVYAICLKWLGKELILSRVKPTNKTKVTMLGYNKQLKWKYTNNKLHIEVPVLLIDELPTKYAYIFKLTDVKE